MPERVLLRIGAVSAIGGAILLLVSLWVLAMGILLWRRSAAG